MENQGPKRVPREELFARAKEASNSPGVYLMKNAEDQILYVGKAKCLKNRLSSYFQRGAHEIARTELLVIQIHHFDVILTETETEALILECTLIKKHKPRFNVRLKDDKAYPYIKVQTQISFPRLEWTRRVLRDDARYFGPFPSGWAARQVLQLLTQSLKLRDCSDNTFRHRSRPCILFEMQRCSAPCVGKISAEDYQDSIRQAFSVLEGKGTALLQSLEKGMHDASDREEFETAAELRDQLSNLRIVMETQGVVEAGVDRDRDVVGLAGKPGVGLHGTVLCIRGGKLVSVRHYDLQGLVAEGDSFDWGMAGEDSEMTRVLASFLSQHYLEVEKEAEKGRALQIRAQEVLVPVAPADLDWIEKALNLNMRVPETKEEQQLINVAQLNATHALDAKARKGGAAGVDARALEEIQEKLHLDVIPHRIECYDISNFQGEESVASRVVFIDGVADKSLYRKYKIKTVVGSNDFAMMKEVLGRRFKNSEDAFPDLVLVDGGKGQLSQAVAILEELQVQGVAVAGLAKARTERDFKSTQVKSTSERVFLPNRKNPVMLRPGTGSFKVLTQLRDEAHRFAIQYHRHLRDKKSITN